MTRSNTTSSPRANAYRNDLKANALMSKLGQGRKITKTIWACLFALLGSVLAMSSSGCSSCHCGGGAGGWLFSNLIEQPVACYREKIWAKRAFNLRYASCDDAYPTDFRAGFIEGYCGACAGGDHHPPALPPEAYWTSRYSTEEGAGKVKSWFAGFPEGAKAARNDGNGKYHQVQVSNELQQAMSQIKSDLGKNEMVDINSIKPVDNSATQPPLPASFNTPPIINNSGQAYEPTYDQTYQQPTFNPADDSFPPIVSPQQANPGARYSPSAPGYSTPMGVSSPTRRTSGAPLGVPGNWRQ